MKNVFCLIFLFFLGLQNSVAQEKIKFRFGINSCHDASHYTDDYIAANNYFSLRKVPLSNFNTVPFTYSKVLGLTVYRNFSYLFSIEKKISSQNIISLNVLLNDGLSIAFSETFPEYTPSISLNNQILGASLFQAERISARRYGITLHHQLNCISECTATVSKRKIRLTSELLIGSNIIQTIPSGILSYQIAGLTANGDTISIVNSVTNTNKKFGVTLIGGFNFKLQNSFTKKEWLCLSISYEQGLFYRDLAVMQMDVTVATVMKQNFNYSQHIFSRGSRLNVTLSKSFGKSNFKRVKKKGTEKSNA
jgi:hypothetical protein